MIIRRDLYLKKLLERKHNRLVKIVTGLRRCGKSFLLNTLLVAELKNTGVADDHIICLSLEGLMNSQYRDPEFTYQHIFTTIWATPKRRLLPCTAQSSAGKPARR